MQWDDGASWMRPNGALDESRIIGRQKIYQGRNGRYVERIQTDSTAGRRSFIYKPLTNADALGREVWAHRNLLPLLPVRYPRLISASQSGDPSAHWTLHEDMGPLEHELPPESLLPAGEAIAQWHSLPVELLPAAWNGHTPRVNEVLARLAADPPRMAAVLTALRIPRKWIGEWLDRLEALQGRPDSETVVSHGDYHPLNLAWKNHELIVLDWEYVHRNSIYWDLYNLLDITSPRHRRTVHSAGEKDAVLSAYVRRRRELDGEWRPPNDFAEGYRLFAAIYSMQILLLIDDDLKSMRFEPSSLIAQQEETAKIWLACIQGGG